MQMRDVPPSTQAVRGHGLAVVPATLPISTFPAPASSSTTPTSIAATWPELVEMLTRHERRRHKDGPGWSPASYARGATRANGNVVAVSCAVADIDHVSLDAVLEIRERLTELGLCHVIYSTYSSAPPDDVRVRVVVPFSSPIEPGAWPDVWQRVNAHVFGGRNDPQTKDPSRFYYLPAAPPDVAVLAKHHAGGALDPDMLPAAPSGVLGAATGTEPGRGSIDILGYRTVDFVANGAPVGEQRGRALAAARAYLGAGYPIDEAAAKVWQGLQNSPCGDQRHPWTYEDALAIAEDLAGREPTPAAWRPQLPGPRIGAAEAGRPVPGEGAADQAPSGTPAAALQAVRAAGERTTQDPGAAFEPSTLGALALLEQRDPAGLARARAMLKEAGVSLRVLDHALKRQHARLRVVRDDRTSTQRTAGATLEGCPAADLTIPEPYFLRPEATGRVLGGGDGVRKEQMIAHAPILITGRLRDVDEGTEALRLAWRRPDGWHDLTIDRGVALDHTKLLALADRGFPVASDNARDVTKYLHEVEAANLAGLPLARVSGHLGWQGRNSEDGFLWGRQLLLPDGSAAAPTNPDELAPADWEDRVSFRGVAAGDDQIADAYHAAGTYQGWVGAVGVLKDYPRPLAMLYAAFVPPLLTILGAPNFAVDLANRTSTGKTTAARAAASVWGKPDERAVDGALGTWDVTRVYLERSSAVLSGLPLILDDTKRAKSASIIADLLYAVASGRGRGRANPRGLAETRTWRTVLLSTGEAPATSYTQDGGTRMRVLEVRGLPFGRVDEGIRRLVDRLNLGVASHYGHAGPLFVRWLQRRRADWARYAEEYRAAVEAYAERPSAAEAGRLAAYAAAIDIAARLAHEALELPWDYRDPLASLWVDIAAEASDASGEVRALRDVVSWAYSRAESFCGREYRDHMLNVRTPPSGWAGRWDPGDDWQFIGFYPTVLDAILREQRYEPEAILAGWKERGWLETSSDRGRYTKRVRVGPESPSLVVIRRAAIAEVDG